LNLIGPWMTPRNVVFMQAILTRRRNSANVRPK
jgi:hypothetical protein